jgi:4-carboxymuconolactone decarboxylase
MAKKLTRFPRLAPEEMTAAQREAAAEIAAGPRGEVRGPFLALIHHPELARRLQALGEQLRWKAKLPPHLIELAVLVTARRWTCQHEWTMHEKLARKHGLEERIVTAIAKGREPEGMPADEAAFDAVRRRFGLDGALELIALCGYYSLMAMVLNTAGMPLPDNAPPPLE